MTADSVEKKTDLLPEIHIDLDLKLPDGESVDYDGSVAEYTGEEQDGFSMEYTEGSWVVGKEETYIYTRDAVLDRLQAKSSEAIPLHEGWDTETNPFSELVLQTDLDGDGLMDQLSVLNFGIKTAFPGEYQTISFLSVIYGQKDVEGKPLSFDELMVNGAAEVVSVSRISGNFNPVNNISIKKNKTGAAQVHYSELDGGVRSKVKLKKGEQASDLDLASAINDVIGDTYGNAGYLADAFVATGQYGPYGAYEDSDAKLFKFLKLPLSVLQDRADRLEDGAGDSTDKWMRALVGSASSKLWRLPELSARRSEITGPIAKEFQSELGSRKMNFGQFVRGRFPGGDTQAASDAWLAEFSAAVTPAFELLGESIDDYNAIAAEYGYDNYVAMIWDRDFHGLSYADVEAALEEYQADFGAELDEYFQTLSSYKEDGEMDLGDVYYLHREWQRQTGGAPKMTFEQVELVMQRFFADQGFDLTKAPYDQIFMDVVARENKYTGIAATWAAPDGSKAWVTAPFPAEGLSTYGLKKLIHEVSHAIEILITSQSPDLHDNMYMGFEGVNTIFKEGFPSALEGLVETQAFMDRYMYDIPGYDAETRERLGQQNEGYIKFGKMRRMVMAAWEHTIYQEKDESGTYIPWEARLDKCIEIGEKYLGLDIPDHQTLFAYFPGHFARTPGEFIQYGIGEKIGSALVEPLYAAIKAGDDAEIKRVGDAYKELYGRMPEIIENDDSVEIFTEAYEKE